ncbi:MAG: hypothetical protein V7641_2900 [Blastocatellia bacterium]
MAYADPAKMEYDRDRMANRRIALKRKLWDYKLAHPCVDCGETDPVVLTFDHKDKKEGAIANLVHNMAHQKFAWDKILAEIEKCEVRCFNCHMRRTARQLNRYKWLDDEMKKHLL